VRLALFNLLPIPSLNGFDLIEGLTLAAWRRPAWRRPLVVTWIGLVLALLLSIGWIVAIALALVR
jgi:Zn-dependent protease